MTLKGNKATDTVCLLNAANTCKAKQAVFLFNEIVFKNTATASTTIGGINGFGFANIGGDENNMFMNMISSLLTKKVFGLLVDGNSSFIDLGVVSEARMKGANN
jgi:hypothetical protein